MIWLTSELQNINPAAGEAEVYFRGSPFFLQSNQFFIRVKVFISFEHTSFEQGVSIFVINLLIRVNLIEVELKG